MFWTPTCLSTRRLVKPPVGSPRRPVVSVGRPECRRLGCKVAWTAGPARRKRLTTAPGRLGVEATGFGFSARVGCRVVRPASRNKPCELQEAPSDAWFGTGRVGAPDTFARQTAIFVGGCPSSRAQLRTVEPRKLPLRTDSWYHGRREPSTGVFGWLVGRKAGLLPAGAACFGRLRANGRLQGNASRNVRQDFGTGR